MERGTSGALVLRTWPMRKARFPRAAGESHPGSPPCGPAWGTLPRSRCPPCCEMQRLGALAETGPWCHDSWASAAVVKLGFADTDLNAPSAASLWAQMTRPQSGIRRTRP